MRKKTFRYILFACLACLLVAGFVLRQQFYGNAVRAGRDLYIGSRADYQSLTDSLLPRLRHHWAFGVYARRINLPETFKPGHYVLEPGMSVIRVARMLKLGLQTPVRVSINNARIPAQLAQKLARQIDADSTAIMQVLTSPEVARGVGFDSVTLFSMFIPNTYEFYWTVTPEEFVQRMKREYDRFWTPGRDALRERSGLSRLEVMTLASIVYEETRKTDEMPRIAGVYVNRLRKGMPLQADPTVKYAMQDFGLRRILHKHLKYESPYNTYRNKGLPPSPICMPGIDAIDAVLAAGVEEPAQVIARVRALEAARTGEREAFDDLATAYARANNLRDAELGEEVDEALMGDAERALASAARDVESQVAAALAADDYAAALAALADLRAPIDAFFADVLVMDEDEAVRANRLRLLNRFVGVFTDVADFGKMAKGGK